MSDTLYVGGATGVGGSGIAISNNHFFADNTARDAYFTTNPTEKKTGTFISVGAGYEQWNGTAWVDKTAVVKGAQGDTGAIGPQGPIGETGPIGPAAVAGEIPSSYIETIIPAGTTSTTLEDVPNMTTTITLDEPVNIAVYSSFQTSTQSGSSASTIGIAINIDGVDHDEKQRYLSGSTDVGIGAIVHRTTTALPAGTYTVKLRYRRVSGVATPGLDKCDMLVMAMQSAKGEQGIKGEKGDTGADGGAIAVDYNVTNAYTKGTLINYTDSLVYKANDDIPANTIFATGDTGATWKLVGSGIALGETSATAYRGDRGKIAYEHSILVDGTNPHATTFANITDKPTTIAGYGITNAVDISTNQVIGGDKTFSNRVTVSGSLISQWGTITADFKVGPSGASVTGYRTNFYGGTNAASLSKWTNSVTGQTANDGLDVGITADGTAEIRQKENLPLNIYTNNTLLATFNADGTTSNLSGTWTTISDARLKKDISDISNPVEKVESIAKCVKHYNFINQDKYAKGKRTGYIAQLLAENGLEGHVTQRTPNDEEEGVLFGWVYKDEEYTETINEEEVKKIRRVVDTEGEMILGIENNFTPYLFPAFVALLERVKKLEERL